MKKAKELVRAAKTAKSKTTTTTPDPLAKRTTTGQLWCTLCDVVVKSDELWKAHAMTRKHREHLSEAKAIVATSGSRAPVDGVSGVVAPIDVVPEEKEDVREEEKEEETEKKTGTTTTTTTSPSNVLPAGFFDKPEDEAKIRGGKQPQDEVTVRGKGGEDVPRSLLEDGEEEDDKRDEVPEGEVIEKEKEMLRSLEELKEKKKRKLESTMTEIKGDGVKHRTPQEEKIDDKALEDLLTGENDGWRSKSMTSGETEKKKRKV